MNSAEYSFKKAKWIRADEKSFPDSEKCQTTIFAEPVPFKVFAFEKIFDSAAKNAVLLISADVSYSLFINGVFIASGPAAVGGDYARKEPLPWRFYDKLDLKLEKGKNKAEIFVPNSPIVMADYSSGKCGVIAECFGENGETLFFTDNGWRSGIDERRLIGNTTDLNKKIVFADNSLEYERALPEFSTLKQLVCEKITPKKTTIAGDTVSFDFGKNYPAYVRLKINSEKERFIAIRPQEKAGLDNYGERVYLKKGENEFISLQMHGMRYLEIDCTGGIPEEISAELLFRHYPVRTDTYYRCSDETLNGIFNVSKRTLLMCMQSYHLDSPIHQEALGCTGDYFIESLMNFYTYGETELTRLDIIRTARLIETTGGVMFHTSYSLIYVQWILSYYHYSGDIKLLEETDRSVDLVLKKFKEYSVDGVIENPPDYLFIDWVLVNGYDMHHPPKNLGQTALNCFYYKALLSAAEIKKLLGKTDEADGTERSAKLLRRKINERFYDESLGLYFAGDSDFEKENIFLPKSDGKKYYTSQANILAVLYGLNETDGADIMEKVMTDEHIVQPQPYFRHFALDALQQCGLFEKYGLSFIRKWKKLIEECDSSLKEIDMPAGFVCDYSHAWSGSPAIHLPAKTLGVKFLNGKIEFVPPVLADLDFAEGVLPMPDGKSVKIRVERLPDGTVERKIF